VHVLALLPCLTFTSVQFDTYVQGLYAVQIYGWAHASGVSSFEYYNFVAFTFHRNLTQG